MRFATLVLCSLVSGVAVAAPPATDYAWIPVDTAVLAHLRGDGMMLLTWLDRSPAMLPPCYAPLRAKVTGYTQLELEGVKKSVFLFEGDAPRSEIEACAEQIGTRLSKQPLKIDRAGELTTLSGTRGFALGFAKGYVVQHDDPQVVVRVLTALRAKTHVSPPGLQKLLPKVNREGTMWSVMLRDYTGAIAGVPSRGAMMTGVLPAARVTLFFDTPADASRVAARFDSPGLDARYASIAAAIKGTASAHGAQVDVELGTIIRALGDANTQGLMQELAAKMVRPLAR